MARKIDTEQTAETEPVRDPEPVTVGTVIVTKADRGVYNTLMSSVDSVVTARSVRFFEVGPDGVACHLTKGPPITFPWF